MIAPANEEREPEYTEAEIAEFERVQALINYCNELGMLEERERNVAARIAYLREQVALLTNKGEK